MPLPLRITPVEIGFFGHTIALETDYAPRGRTPFHDLLKERYGGGGNSSGDSFHAILSLYVP